VYRRTATDLDPRHLCLPGDGGGLEGLGQRLGGQLPGEVEGEDSRRCREPLGAVLRVEAPSGWSVRLDGLPLDRSFPLEPKERVLVSLEVRPGRGDGDVRVFQETWTEGDPIAGGITYRFQTEDARARPR